MRCQDCCEVAGKCERCESRPLKLHTVEDALRIVDEIIASQERAIATAKEIVEAIRPEASIEERRRIASGRIERMRMRMFRAAHKYE